MSRDSDANQTGWQREREREKVIVIGYSKARIFLFLSFILFESDDSIFLITIPSPFSEMIHRDIIIIIL